MKIWQMLFFVMGLIALAGCRKSIKSHKKIKNSKNLDTQLLKKEKRHSSDLISESDYQQLLAMHNEIPDMLLGFEVDTIIKDSSNPEALEVIYKPVKNKTMSQEEIKKSYSADMEMLGWKMIGEFDGENIQMIFQKAGGKLLSTVLIQKDLCIKVTVCTKK
jgi:uncharacterized protein YbaP (TraB family)